MTSISSKTGNPTLQFKQILQHYLLPPHLQIYLNSLQNTITQQQPKKTKTDLQYKHFKIPILEAFGCLSITQKINFLQKTLYFLKSTLDAIDIDVDKQHNNDITDIRGYKQNFQTMGQIQETILGIGYWREAKIQYCSERNLIIVEAKKKNYRIGMDNYLVRKSRKYKNTLVLKSILDSPNTENTIYIAFRQSIFQEIYDKIFQVTIANHNNKIHTMLMDKIQKCRGNKNSQIFLCTKTIQQFIEFKSSVTEKMMVTKFNFAPIYLQQKVSVGHSKNYGEYYRLDSVLGIPTEQLTSLFMDKFQSCSHKYLVKSQILENFAGKYFVAYMKHQFPIVQQLIEMEHLFLYEFSISNLQNFLVLKAYDWTGTPKILEFLHVKIRPMRKGTRLMITCKFNSENLNNKKINKKNKKQFILEFLKEFYQMILRKQISINQFLKSKFSTSDTNQIFNEMCFFDESDNLGKVNLKKMHSQKPPLFHAIQSLNTSDDNNNMSDKLEDEKTFSQVSSEFEHRNNLFCKTQGCQISQNLSKFSSIKYRK